MNDLLKLLAAIATKQRGNRFIIDEMTHGEDWYLWFNAELDDNNPKPGTCDIYIQEDGTPPSFDDCGFCVVKDANWYGVLRFLTAIGVSNLPEKSRVAYYAANLAIKPTRTEPQE